MKNAMQSLCFLMLVLALTTSMHAQASSDTPGKVIAGWVEKITFSSLDKKVKAKLDTGANTSSVFAKQVERIERDGDKWVRFLLVLKDEHGDWHEIPTEAPLSRRVKIKNHDGDHDRRVVVDLAFCFDGRSRVAEFSLADRSEYIYSVLLGREFMEDVAVVDPGATFLTQARCAAPAKE